MMRNKLILRFQVSIMYQCYYKREKYEMKKYEKCEFRGTL